MIKDKFLEEVFLTQKPKFDDQADFMNKLNKRLDAVEFIKKYQETTIRRYKMAIVVAFVVGIISGGVTIAYILSTPATIPLFSFGVQTKMLLWLSENSRLIVATVLALLMTLGTMSIINNVQEIRKIHSRLSV
jgi:hypothetical protein